MFRYEIFIGRMTSDRQLEASREGSNEGTPGPERLDDAGCPSKRVTNLFAPVGNPKVPRGLLLSGLGILKNIAPLPEFGSLRVLSHTMY